MKLINSSGHPVFPTWKRAFSNDCVLILLMNKEAMGILFIFMKKQSFLQCAWALCFSLWKYGLRPLRKTYTGCRGAKYTLPVMWCHCIQADCVWYLKPPSNWAVNTCECFRRQWRSGLVFSCCKGILNIFCDYLANICHWMSTDENAPLAAFENTCNCSQLSGIGALLREIYPNCFFLVGSMKE